VCICFRREHRIRMFAHTTDQMSHAMQRVLEGATHGRALLANTEGVSCADCEALQHPAVIASDWIGFICLFGSSFILVLKLMSFTGPDQDDKYYMGYVPAHACSCATHNLYDPARTHAAAH